MDPPGLVDPRSTDPRTGGPRGSPVLGPVDSPLNRWTHIACMAPYINSAARTCKRV